MEDHTPIRRNFWDDKRGATAVEYVLSLFLLGLFLAVIGCFFFLTYCVGVAVGVL